MKKYNILLVIFIFFGFVISCNEKDNEIQGSVPSIESLTIKNGDKIILNDSIFFDAKVQDAIRPLSTLEVELVLNNQIINKKSIRTKGNSADLQNVSLFVPFNANIANGDSFELNFTLINVDGNQTKQQKILKAQRPELPEKLYVILNDKSVIELNVNKEKPYLYESVQGNYQNSFKAKVATSEDLLKATYIWNGTTENNTATIGKSFGTDIKFAYDDWIINKIIFNTYSFTFEVEGLPLAISINNTRLRLSDEYLYAEVAFTKGKEITFEGIRNMEEAYNRDFFQYNPATKKYTFVGETGSWQVFYSFKYDYIWINRMKDVAPQTYWIIGQGFTSAPRWHDDFTAMGWSWNDVKQVTYMKPIATDRYQADVYLSDKPTWGLDMKFYSSLNENNYNQAILSKDLFFGDSEGFNPAGRDSADVVNNSNFTEGYYRIVLDVSDGLDKAKVEFKKL